jgi:hypothetical protein
MSYQARYIGIDEVIEAFNKKAKSPYFSLWLKGQPLCQWREGDSIDDSIEKIKEEIELGVRRNISHEHELFLHTKKEKDYTRKSESYCVIGFRCFEVGAVGMPIDHNAYNNFGMQQELSRLKSEVAALQAKKVDQDDEDDEDDEENNFISGFQQLIDHPLVVGMINKWMTGSTPINNLAGIDDTNLQDTINILFSKGVNLQHLQKLAAMPEDKIQMLIQML